MTWILPSSRHWRLATVLKWLPSPIEDAGMSSLESSTVVVVRPLPALLLIATLGCSRGEFLCEIQGTVTYQGRAIPNGSIHFVAPATQQRIGAAMETSGSYQIRLPAGEYQVAVESAPAFPPGWREGDPMPDLTPLIPTKYNHPATSGLTVTVAAEQRRQTIDFALP